MFEGRRKYFYVGLFLCFIVAICVILNNRKSPIEETVVANSALPKIYLTLNNTSLEEIDNGDKSTVYENNSVIVESDGEFYDFSEVEIKARGNGTRTVEKRPYQIKFNEKTDIFGLGLTKKYVLLACAFDPSFLRNDVANWLAEEVGEDFPMRGNFVEFYVDTEYIGLYYISTKAEINSNSVALSDQNGVLMELDNVYHEFEEQSLVFQTETFGDYFVMIDSVNESEEEAQNAKNNFQESYNLFERAVNERDFEKVSELIDVDSFAEYFLVSELSLNHDAYVTSFRFYKDGEDDKIHAGPTWDFDRAFWMETDIKFYLREDEKESEIIYKMFEMPEFEKRVAEIFQDRLAGREDELIDYVEKLAAKIRKATIHNNQKWEADDFDESVENLKNWILERFKFMEEEYNFTPYDYLVTKVLV